MTEPLHILCDDGKSEIRYVYHLSDIHIRNYQRHEEYLKVFNQTSQKIQSLMNGNNGTSLIVLTGDIMHTKTELSPESIRIACIFFKKLSDLAPVILIAGNHDCNLSNKHRLDALTPLVEDIGGNSVNDLISDEQEEILSLNTHPKSNLKNFYYLKRSGFYQYHNIVFGVTSLLDDKLITIKQLNLKKFNKINHANKYKIALYHGPIYESKTESDFIIRHNCLKSSTFDGYDYVMLGDIHKHQYMNEKKTIAYAGSLIQQSHGESINNHGILKWNLLNGKSKLHEVPNDYGYCTIEIKDGKMISTEIPQKPHIRFNLENTSEVQYRKVKKSLEKNYDVVGISQEPIFKVNLYKTPDDVDLNDVGANIVKMSHIDKIKYYLTKKGITADDIESVVKLHENICKKVSNSENSKSMTEPNQKWEILELRFSNMLCYGEKNIIDFTQYEPNQVIGIIAPNHYGKSAIIDIILFCLFEKCSRGNRRDIMNVNKDDMFCSMVFKIGSHRYLIERNGKRQSKQVSIKVKFHLIDDDKMIPIGGDKNETNSRIAKLVGSYDDYVKTCIRLQDSSGKCNSFMNMTPLEKKDLLCNILNLDIFTNLNKASAEKMAKLWTKMSAYQKLLPNETIVTLINKKIDLNNKNLQILQNARNDFRNLSKFLEVGRKNVHSPLIKYKELENYQLNTVENILDTNKILEKKLVETNVLYDIKLLRTNLKSSKASMIKLDNDIEGLKENIYKLSLENIKVPVHEDVDSLMATKSIKEKRIKKLKCLIKNSSELNESELEDKISELRKSIQNVDPTSNEILLNLRQKLEKCQWLIANIKSNNEEYIDVRKRNQLLHEINVNNKFMQLINNNLHKLGSCVDEKMSTVVHDNILSVMEENNKWIKNVNEWSEQAKHLIIMYDMFGEEYHILLQEISILKPKIDIFENNVRILKENDNIHKEIEKLEKKLHDVRNIKNLKLEIRFLSREIDNLSSYIQQIESNAIINQEIHKINEEINKKVSIRNKMELNINDYESKIIQWQKKDTIIKSIGHDIQLLKEYYLEFMMWQTDNTKHNNYIKEKKENSDQLIKFDTQIRDLKQKLQEDQKILDNYLSLKEKIDQIQENIRITKLYHQITNYKGIPYEILKVCLNPIESMVNNVLSQMTTFSVEFIHYDTDENSYKDDGRRKKISLKTKKVLQKTKQGNIDIIIHYQNQKPNSVEMACGFEKFIIDIAMRITLIKLSSNSKPNFFVVDEGWVCLDTDRRNGLEITMNYIKSQYDHIIIMSHLVELHAYCDYMLTIDRENDCSFVSNKQYPKISDQETANDRLLKKKKIKKIVVV